MLSWQTLTPTGSYHICVILRDSVCLRQVAEKGRIGILINSLVCFVHVKAY